MNEIIFESIRHYEGSQQTGFEELVCQIARRTRPADVIYRRVEGAGGDGGVEAYYLLPDGKEIGFQAKYFVRTGDIDWSQVEKSVQQAINIHPKLTRYIIAFACDLTDRSGKQGKGLTGWEHWENHKTKWCEWASGRGLAIEFLPWTKSEIVDLLLHPNNNGLIEYWFNMPFFDVSWFEKHFEAVKADLDERYHPEDHVAVEIARLFDGFARSKSFQKKLVALFSDLPSTSGIAKHIIRLKVQPDREVLTRLDNTLAAIKKLCNEIAIPLHICLPVDNWKKKVIDGIEAIESLDRWLWAEERQVENPPREHSQIDYDLHTTRQLVAMLLDQLRHVQSQLDDVDILADQQRVGLVIGRVGTGKSHLCADSVSRALRDGSPAILLLGQYFGSDDLWQTIFKSLIYLATPSKAFSEPLLRLPKLPERAACFSLTL
jgi:hypothetical protein